jgi:hypothetical protein
MAMVTLGQTPSTQTVPQQAGIVPGLPNEYLLLLVVAIGVAILFAKGLN